MKKLDVTNGGKLFWTYGSNNAKRYSDDEWAQVAAYPELESILLGNQPITKLPPFVAPKQLELRGLTKLASLAGLERMVTLESLALQDGVAKFADWFELIRELPELTELDVLVDIPRLPPLETLPSLRKLVLRGTPNLDLADALKRLSTLKTLHTLVLDNFKKLPDAFGGLTQITTLAIDNTPRPFPASAQALIDRSPDEADDDSLFIHRETDEISLDATTITVEIRDPLKKPLSALSKCKRLETLTLELDGPVNPTLAYVPPQLTTLVIKAAAQPVTLPKLPRLEQLTIEADLPALDVTPFPELRVLCVQAAAVVCAITGLAGRKLDKLSLRRATVDAFPRVSTLELGELDELPDLSKVQGLERVVVWSVRNRTRVDKKRLPPGKWQTQTRTHQRTYTRRRG